MANVIEFPGRRDALTPVDQSVRADAIRAAVGGAGSRLKQQIEVVAKNLFRLLAEGERRERGFRARFCQQAFGSKPADSTKRLHEWALDPTKDNDAKRLGMLRAKASGYLPFCEIIARMSGRERDAVLVDLFSDVDLGRTPTTNDDPLTVDLKAQVWRAWERETEKIIADLDLQRAFQLSIRLPSKKGEPLEEGQLNFGDVIWRSGGTKLGFDGKEEPSADWTDDVRLHILNNAPGIFLGEAGRILDANIFTQPLDGKASEPKPGLCSWIRLWFQFWWVILPIGSDRIPRGCFLFTMASENLLLAFSRIEREPLPVSAEWSPDMRWNHLFHSRVRRDGPDSLNHMRRSRSQAGVIPQWNARYSTLAGEESLDPVICKAVVDESLEVLVRELWGRSLSEMVDHESDGLLPDYCVRIVAPSEPNISNILHIFDGSDADWVGPSPDHWQSVEHAERFAHRGHPKDDLEEALSAAALHAEKYLCRFDHDPPFRLAFESRDPRGGRFPTIGQKLERSLLELPEGERPTNELRRRAERIVARVNATAERVLADRRRRFANLGAGEI